MAVEEGAGYQESPTYSVAVIAFIFILISLLVERGIHRLRKYLKEKKQKPLQKVLDKMTEELMLLGFISLLITVFQNSIIKVCVSEGFSRHMLPCTLEDYASPEFAPTASREPPIGRRLLDAFKMESSGTASIRRLMAEAPGALGHCEAKGKVPFVSLEVLHQLHLFIFVLAVTHVFYSLLTVCLGFARVNHWRKWERETRCEGYDGNLDLERRLCKKLNPGRNPSNTFVDRHANHACYRNPISIWILCFFQQFFTSVSREDYLVFRVGFINQHGLAESFNFRDYVIRSMEVEFKKVIGISWWLWLVVVLFLLLDVAGWYTYFWAAFIPLIIVLVIGTKQQHIISTLALQAKKRAEEILAAGDDAQKLSKSRRASDTPTVSLSDKLFWFDNPRVLLRLIHFVIFQNSFELAIFFWLVTTFGWNSCILGNHSLLIVRLIIGIFTQLLASYSTLPIYALVTQMGSQLKATVFTKQVNEGIQGWKAKAGRRKMQQSSTPTSGENSGSGLRPTAQDATAAEESVVVHSSTELPPLAPEGVANPNRVMTENNTDAENFTKMCQLMYGKQHGLEKVKAAQINPR